MPELGKKFECTSCSTKFYDLGRPEPICPKCGFNMKDAVQNELFAVSAAARRRRRAEMALEGEEADEEPPDLSDEILVSAEDDDEVEEEEEEDVDLDE
ncbi:MAG TPA: FYDLN acid domain-containing protein [Thermoanaerobaculia bacterium]|nr:FYDLN acid domain-containing protein [Thermoanaerobaculia bacterium]